MASKGSQGMPSREEYHVCIVGAGIVGLASSILLRRQGCKVTLLEKDPSLHARPAGGIQLHPNAIRVLQETGTYAKIMQKAVAIRAIVLKRYSTGRTLHAQHLFPRTGNGHDGAPPVVTVQRAHLRQVLYDEAVACGVEFRFGVAVQAEDVDINGGCLRLCGPETGEVVVVSADLFLVADGANSTLREVVTGRKRDLVPHGTVVHRITIDESLIRGAPNLRHLVAKDDPNIVVWLGPGSQAVTYSLDGVFNIAFTRAWRPVAGTNDDAPFYGPQVVDLLHFGAGLEAEGWDPVLRELVGLGGTTCHRWMFFEPEIDGEETPWVRGDGRCFCLVGDAAHQTLPYLAQGAAMGLESASVLSHLLGRARKHERGRIRAALGVYERPSKERTGRIISASLENGRVWQLPDGPAQEERDRQLLEGGERPGAGFPNMLADPAFQQWLWGFDAAKAAGEAWEACSSGARETGKGLMREEASSLVISKL